ncbi:hypothetical protein Tco_1395889, partial [Tanacetum coccineum]
LEVDFGRILKAKEAEFDQAKVNKVVQVSNDEDVFGDEDLVLFNDVKYPLTDAEIMMFKERPTRSRVPTRQVSSTFIRSIAPSIRSKAPTTSTSTRSRALTASTSNAQAASNLAPRGTGK